MPSSPFVKLLAGAKPGPGSIRPDAGNAQDFQRLIVPHMHGAYNVARFLTRDADLAEDVVQDAMLRAYRAFGQFRGGSAKSWLFTIVRNCALTAIAKRRNFAALTLFESSLPAAVAEQMCDMPDLQSTPEEQLAEQFESQRVRAAVEAVPEPFREVIVLRELEGLAYAEIAQVTGVPLGTVMSRLARGRAILAKQLLPPAADAREASGSAGHGCLH